MFQNADELITAVESAIGDAKPLAEVGLNAPPINILLRLQVSPGNGGGFEIVTDTLPESIDAITKSLIEMNRRMEFLEKRIAHSKLAIAECRRNIKENATENVRIISELTDKVTALEEKATRAKPFAKRVTGWIKGGSPDD